MSCRVQSTAAENSVTQGGVFKVGDSGPPLKQLPPPHPPPNFEDLWCTTYRRSPNRLKDAAEHSSCRRRIPWLKKMLLATQMHWSCGAHCTPPCTPHLVMHTDHSCLICCFFLKRLGLCRVSDLHHPRKQNKPATRGEFFPAEDAVWWKPVIPRKPHGYKTTRSRVGERERDSRGGEIKKCSRV